MGFLERMSWLNSFHQAHDSKLQFLALHPGKFRISLHAFVLFQIFWDQLKIWRDVDMEALKASCFIQLLNCSQPKGMTGVDPHCKVVILKSYFTESWEVGGTWNLSMIQGKKWIPSAQRQALHKTQLSWAASQEPRKATCSSLILDQLLFQHRLKGNPI